MSNQNKVAVIVPCFNHGEFLPEAMASVVNAGRADIEVVWMTVRRTNGRVRRQKGWRRRESRYSGKKTKGWRRAMQG
jgi:GT2 family glycosyltransferase